MGTELLELGIAIVVIVFILLWLRRAALHSRDEAPASAQERLAAPAPEARPARAPRVQDRARRQRASGR